MGGAVVGDGTIGTGVRCVVVGVGEVTLGSGIDGNGATTVCCLELLTITSAMTNPTTTSTATAATIHSQRGDFGGWGDGGCCGGSPGGYCGPYCPVA